MRNNLIYIGIGAALGVVVASIATFAFFSLNHGSGANSIKPNESDEKPLKETEIYPEVLSNESLELLPFEERVTPMLESANSFVHPLIINDLMKDLKLERLVQILAWSEEATDGHFKNEVQEAAVRRIAVKDPTNAISAVRKHANKNRRLQLTEIIFQEWSVSDLDNAVKSASTLNHSERNAALEGIMSSRLDIDFGQIREIVTQLNLLDHLSRALETIVFRQALVNPNGSWKELVSLLGKEGRLLDEFELKSLSIAAHALIQSNRQNALHAMEESLVRIENTVIKGQVLDAIANIDASLAIDLTRSIGIADRNILERVVRVFAENDPASAVSTAIEMDSVDTKLQRAAIETWAKKDPESLLNSIEGIPRNLQEWASRQSLYSIARTNPMSAIDQLTGIQNLPLKKRIARTIVRNWSHSDPQAAFEWTKSNLDVEEWATELRHIVLETFAETSPTHALSMAIEEEIGDSEVGLEATVISRVARTNVDLAVDMLDNARNLETTTIALLEVGKALVRKGNTDQAIDLMQALPAQNQRRYISSIADEWASSDYLDLFSKIDKLPSDGVILSDIAIAIAHAQYFFNTQYSSAQTEFLKEHLPVEMMNLIE